MTTPPCRFCGATATMEQAVSDGWIPSFWDAATDRDGGGPVCGTCQERLGIVFNEEQGDCELPAPPEPDVTADGK